MQELNELTDKLYTKIISMKISKEEIYKYLYKAFVLGRSPTLFINKEYSNDYKVIDKELPLKNL
jgi:hypothetical protein